MPSREAASGRTNGPQVGGVKLGFEGSCGSHAQKASYAIVVE